MRAGFRGDRAAGGLAAAVLLLAAAWLAAGLVAAGATQNLLFDGAMNLEVSRSLSEGMGPRRLYDSADLFAPGVQTKEPYLLVGAAVFSLLGVGPVQAQLPNLLFLALLVATIAWSVRRLAGVGAALAAVVLVLALPAMPQYGLNGYGEIPSFAFGLASLAVVAWPGLFERRTLSKCIVAGLLAGLAISTKTVGLIQAGGIGLILLLRAWTESRASLRDTAATAGVFVAGMAIPLALVELWRLAWLGAAEYRAWWDYQASRILYQAGVASTASSPPPSPILQKIATHFRLLSTEMGSGRWVTAFALLLPLAGASFTHWGKHRPSRWLVAGLGAIAVCYLIWWLAITPTEKAWLRRIYIGLACLAMIAAITGWHAARDAIDGRSRVSRFANGCLLAALIVTFVPFVTRSLQRPISLQPNEAVTRTIEAAELVRALDADTPVFAYGWYSAPGVGLYSGRHLIDLTDWPIGGLVGKPAYLVADRAAIDTDILSGILARYPHRALLDENIHAQVYSLDFSRPADPFTEAERAAAPQHIDFVLDPEAPAHDLEAFDSVMGGRWTGTDSEVLLRYGGEDALTMRAYMALPAFYRFDRPLSGRLVVPGCDPAPFAFEGAGWKTFLLPMDCSIPSGRAVRVRILLDNVFDLPRVYVRQRGMLLQSIGFRHPPEQTEG